MPIPALPPPQASYYSVYAKSPRFAGWTNTTSSLAPQPQFGQKKNQNSTGYSALYTTVKRMVGRMVREVRQVASTLEYWQANVQLGCEAMACMLTFLPMPDFCRRAIERRYFFGPIQLSNISLLNDKSLEPRISEYTLNLGLYKGTLKTAGLAFNPAEDAIRLHAWHIPAKAGKPTVIFNHGRGTNISYLSKAMRVISDQGYGIFVYDYPGFGQSQGQPGEEASYKAGLTISKFVEKRLGVPQQRQILMGYSMGSAVATDVASRLKALGTPPKALVLINTFPSIKQIFRYKRNQYAWAKPLLKTHRINLSFNSAKKLKTLDQLPILILQGQHDTDTPASFIQKTMVDAPELKGHDITFEPLEGAKHRLKDNDYPNVGRHFFAFMNRRFPA